MAVLGPSGKSFGDYPFDARIITVSFECEGQGFFGLSAAIALRRRGIEAVLWERTTELKEIGAGIAIAANAMKALGSLGLADMVRQIGAESRFYEIRSWRGEILSRVSVSEQREKVGASSIAAHRAYLQKALLQGLVKAGGEVHLGAECIGFVQTLSLVKKSPPRPWREPRSWISDPGNLSKA